MENFLTQLQKKVENDKVLTKDEEIINICKGEFYLNVKITNENTKQEQKDVFNFVIDLDQNYIIRSIIRKSNGKEYTRYDEEEEGTFLYFVSEEMYCENCNITNVEVIRIRAETWFSLRVELEKLKKDTIIMILILFLIFMDKVNFLIFVFVMLKVILYKNVK
jgi:hypothetical protein